MVRYKPDPRLALARLAETRGEPLAPLLRMLGYAHGYLGGFVRRGRPVALPIQEHRGLTD